MNLSESNVFSMHISQCLECVKSCFNCLKTRIHPDLESKSNNNDPQLISISMLIECAVICKEAALHINSDPEFIPNLYILLETIRKRCAQDCNLFKDNYYNNCTDICSNCPNNLNNNFK